tara:strand:+ start:6700 stop:6891 length:192 start_codon:yes stop_codon:yes gene_type:complete
MAVFTNLKLGTGSSSDQTTSWSAVALTTETNFEPLGSLWQDGAALSPDGGFWADSGVNWEDFG